MKTKSMTLRLPADKAAELEAVARADHKAVSGSVREAIDNLIAERRKDKEFQARLRAEDPRAIRALSWGSSPAWGTRTGSV